MTSPADPANPHTPVSPSTSLRDALAGIGLLLLTLVLVELAVPSTSRTALDVASDAAVTVIFGGTGLVAWYRRPHNATGRLLVVTALAIWAAGAQDDDLAALRVVGTLSDVLPLALLLHLLLAFPSGRLSSRAARVVVVVGYAVAVLPQVVRLLAPATDDVLWTVQGTVGAATLVATVLLSIRRLAGLPGTERRQLLPFLGYGCLTIAVLLVTVGALHSGLGPAADTLAVVVQFVVLGGLPVAFLVGLTFGAFGRAGEVTEVARGLAESPVEPALLDGLAVRALGDPTAHLLWATDAAPDQLVDSAGQRRSVPSGPGWWPIVRGPHRVGGLLYDRDLTADRSLVATVAAQLGLAMDHRRLVVELRSAVQQLHVAAGDLRTSRRRIVVAADAERRRIAQDLHDGAQQRVVLVGIDVQRLGRRADDAEFVRAEAARVAGLCGALLDELRDLVQGIMPSRLRDHGLAAAVAALADQVPVPVRVDVAPPLARMDAEIESTGYFVVAEALTNAVKHAGASQITVTLAADDGHLRIEVCDDGRGVTAPAPGFGLRSLQDRVETLGGTLALDRSPSGGTRLRAQLPTG